MTRFLLAALLVACCGTAAAQTVTVSRDSGETETMQTSVAEASPPQTEEPARTCLRSTGSRIVASRNLRAEKDRKPQGCAVAAGRVYTAEDLDRSGHMNLADALRSHDTSTR